MRSAHSPTRRGSPFGPALALLLTGIFGALALLPGCSRTQSGQTTQITVAGSTSVTPFAETLAEEFMRKHPESHVDIQGIGSSAGIQATESGAADVCMSSRALKADEVTRLVPITIALDAMAIIVHPSNRVTNLTLEQVRGIFAGTITNWSEVGGSAAPITVVNREAGSGTRGAFEELVMGKNGPPVSPNSIRQGSNGAVRAVVEGDPNAIGYISLGIVTPQVRTVKVDGVAPTPGNIGAGRYRLVRPFLFAVPRGSKPAQLSREYVDYVLSDQGQRSLAHAGLIPSPDRETPWKD